LQELALLLEERDRRRRTELRNKIQLAAKQHVLTPDIVEAYAALHLTTDDGQPLRAFPHHRLWLQFMCDTDVNKLLIIAPPESAKTTWTISAYLGARIGIWPESNVIIGSVAESVAEKRSLSLRGMVVTEEWQETFPDVLPVASKAGLKWETREWSVAPGGIPSPGRLHPTISAYGTGGSITGSRGDLVLADDLLDYDNTRTQHQREQVDNWQHNSLLPRRKSKVGRAFVIGTAWHPEDIYSTARFDGSWQVVHSPLLSESEKVYAFISYPSNYKGRKLGEPVAPEDAIAMRPENEQMIDAIRQAEDYAKSSI